MVKSWCEAGHQHRASRLAPMLSRFCTRSSSLAPRLLLQEFTYPCVKAPHTLQQLLILHTSDISFISPFIRTEAASRKFRLRDGSVKHFVRSLSDGSKTNRNDGVELQVLSQWQSDDGKEFDDEGKLSQSEKLEAGLGNVLANLRVQPRNSREEDLVHSNRVKRSFWRRARPSSSSCPGITEYPTKPAKMEESTNYAGDNEISTVKEISTGSKRLAEVHTVLIRRKLTRKFLHQLREKIDFLHSEAVPVIQVKSLLERRAFLSASPEKLAAVVEVLTEIFESKDIPFKVLTANAGTLEQPLEMSRHKMQLLSELEVDRRACIKLGTTKHVWTLRTQKFEERLNFLKELGMNAEARSKVLSACPTVLLLSENSLKASLVFLESIGLSGPNLLRFVELCPSVLGSSVDKSLAVSVKLFQDWGFSVKAIIKAIRQVPHHSVKHIQSQVKILRDHGLTQDDVVSIIRRRPDVLNITNQDLKAKLDFLRQVNRDISEVLKCPRFLTTSLKDRIIPRFKALEAVSWSEKPRLSPIVLVTTSNFKSRFGIPESVECP